MEHNRQLRFLIPPLVFFAALALGAAIDPNLHLLSLFSGTGAGKDSTQILAVVLAGGVAVVALGFMISGVAILLLRVVFFIPWLLRISPGGYEVSVPRHALPAMWSALGCAGTPVTRDMLPTVAAYSHSKLKPELNDWTGRRWNVFMVSVNCVVAIGLAHLAAYLSPWYSIAHTPEWWRIDLALSAVLVANGFVARYQAGRFVGFVAERVGKNGAFRPE